MMQYLVLFDMGVGVPDYDPLPNLQFAVLGSLRTEAKSGQAIRAHLRELGLAKSGPAFYRLMGRLEEGNLVKGWYEQEVIDGQILKERHYRILAAGTRAFEKTEAFHLRVIQVSKVVQAYVPG